jgi:murein DD-endopeptidase MepM/ murein hydrolase activator NlpD
MCEGPRRVPLLDGEALAHAESLGLIGGGVARAATAAAPPSRWVDAARTAGAAAPEDLLWPVPEGRLWRGYGPRQGFRRTRHGLVRTRRRHMHQGVDIGARQGSVIVAVADGLVAYSDNGMSGYGNAVLLVHADCAVSMYAHCYETYVLPGQLVRRGQVIAAVGQTGIAHGAHLHFEYRERGQTVDPYRRFTSIPELHPLSSSSSHRSRDSLPPGSEAEPDVGEVPAAPPAEPPSDTDHDAEP